MGNKSNKGFVSPCVLKVRLEAITGSYFSEIKEELANIEKAISVDNDSERDDQLKILIGRYQEIVRLLGEKIQKFIFLIEALVNKNAKASVVELYDITLNDYGDIHRKDCARIIAPTPRSKAANTPQKQEFVASAVDPMKLTKIKGSNLASKSRICRFHRRSDETDQDRRQQKAIFEKN